MKKQLIWVCLAVVVLVGLTVLWSVGTGNKTPAQDRMSNTKMQDKMSDTKMQDQNDQNKMTGKK